MRRRRIGSPPQLASDAVRAVPTAPTEAEAEPDPAAATRRPDWFSLARGRRRRADGSPAAESAVEPEPRDDAWAAEAEDRAALTLLRRYRKGDREAAAALFDAWFDRALAYTTVWLGDPRRAERVTVAALREVLDSPAAEGQRDGFRALLVGRLHLAGGAPAHDPPRARPRPPRDDDELLRNLGKLSAADVYLLLVRLPVAERRLLALLHLLKLTPDVAGPLLGLEPDDLRRAEGDALRQLRLAVERFGRSGSRDLDRLASHTFAAYSPVVRSRWSALATRG